MLVPVLILGILLDLFTTGPKLSRVAPECLVAYTTFMAETKFKPGHSDLQLRLLVTTCISFPSNVYLTITFRLTQM